MARTKSNTAALAIRQTSYLEELGYEGESMRGVMAGLFSVPGIFLVLFKSMILWMGYTLICNHIVYMNHELRTTQQQRF